MVNSLGSRAQFRVGDQEYTLFRLDAVYKAIPQARFDSLIASRSSSKTY